MKYKVNDEVRIRQWKPMERQFGLSNVDINCRLRFSREMKQYCGKSARIVEVESDRYRLEVEDQIVPFSFTDDMLEGYAFEYGDEIEVNSDEGQWERKIYVGYVDGSRHPYQCVSKYFRQYFNNGKNFVIDSYKHARPIKKNKELEELILETREVFERLKDK